MLSECPTIEELTALCHQCPDLEVTLGDSYAAGNCTEGTEDFVGDYFPDRDSVTVKELIPYMEYRGVQIVLEYKFRQLEGQVETKESQDDALDDLPDEHPF